MITRKILWLSVALSSFFNGLCQEGKLELYQNGYYIKQYSEVTGLVSNFTKSVFEDSKGFLWIATFKGLSRFDGKQFLNFGVSEGLPSSNIIQVCEDTLGFIYVATTSGIARYSGYNKTTNSYFHTYPQTMNLSAPISGMHAADSTSIIFQQSDGEVLLLKKNKVRQLSPKASIRGIVIYRTQKKFYYVISDSLRVFDAQFKKIKSIYFPEAEYKTLSVDRKGHMHIYLNGEKTQLGGAEIICKSRVPDSIDFFSMIDTADHLVYAKKTRIFLYKNSKSLEIMDVRKISSRLGEIKVTRDGSIWVLTINSGILRITQLPYTQTDVQNKYYLSCKKNKKIIVIDTLSSSISADFKRKNEIQNIYEFIDSKGTAWFCTNNGIYKKTPGKSFEHFLPQGDEGWGELRYFATEAFESNNGDIWFGGTFGLVRYSQGSYKSYTRQNGLYLTPIQTNQINEDKYGTIVFRDYYSNMLRVQGDTLIRIAEEIGNPDFKSNSIKTDDNGSIWTGYDKKLFKLDKKSSGSYYISDSIIPASLFSSPEIKDFGFDEENNCWIAYPGGKMQVYFKNPNGHYNSINSITFTSDDGLGLTAATGFKLFPDYKGNMVATPLRFAQNDRIFMFPISKAIERRKMEPPNISLSSVSINYKTPDWLDLGYFLGPDGLPVSPRLANRHNNITFDYAGILLSNPEGITYQVKLQGYDEEWQTLSKTSVNYTNLPSGKYTFMLKAANANGTWSDIYKYQFSIMPPWYKTWWAMLLWVFIGISIIVFIFFLRLNSVRMDHLKESNKFKSGLIGLIGHDMMSPLRYIAKVALQLQTYNGKLSKQTTMESLGDINTTASQLQFFGESIIHWIKIQNTEFSPVMEKFYVNKTITELTEFHHPLAVEKGNNLTCDIHDDLYCYQDPTLVRIILHNLLLNSNKFTNRGKIVIYASMEKSYLIIKVQDNGKGMDEEKVNALNSFHSIESSLGTKKEKGWGMGYKVIIDLLKYSKGTLQVKSHPGEGTEVTIKLPAEKAEQAVSEVKGPVKYLVNVKRAISSALHL